ncbi:hypothetical protein ACFVRW_23620 [Bacillus subtilis]
MGVVGAQAADAAGHGDPDRLGDVVGVGRAVRLEPGSGQHLGGVGPVEAVQAGGGLGRQGGGGGHWAPPWGQMTL